ncbi:hypothetical protein J6590_083845 [Homalodisca vitripennis]|nr:hypothetical protein J6590_083845 [Homalodisca vitripennis]
MLMVGMYYFFTCRSNSGSNYTYTSQLSLHCYPDQEIRLHDISSTIEFALFYIITPLLDVEPSTSPPLLERKIDHSRSSWRASREVFRHPLMKNQAFRGHWRLTWMPARLLK